MNKEKLMGKKIKFNEILVRKTRGNRHSWKIVEGPVREGWIAGFRTVHEGTGKFYGDELPTFKDRKAVEHLLVAESPTKLPVRVPLKALRKNENTLPLLASGSAKHENQSKHEKIEGNTRKNF